GRGLLSPPSETAACWTVMPVPLTDVAGARAILFCAFILQLALQVVMKSGDEGTGDARIGGIVGGILARRIDVFAFKAHVIAAEGQALVAQNFLAEARWADAQVGFLDVIHTEASEVADL